MAIPFCSESAHSHFPGRRDEPRPDMSRRFVYSALVLGLFLTVDVEAQSTFDQYGSTRADGLGQATTAAPREHGAYANPALSATASERTVAFYAREGFGLSALRYGAMSVTTPFRWGTVLGGASTFGFDDYREVHLSVGYARSLSFGTTRRVHLGATVRYYHTRIATFGSAGAVAVNPGLMVRLLPSLHLGAHVVNVNRAHLTEAEPLPQTFSLGVAYDALEHVHIMADVYKDVAFPATVRLGIEVQPVRILDLRAGTTTTPARFTWGAGFRLDPIRAEVAAERHQQLGWSPSASLQIRW